MKRKNETILHKICRNCGTSKFKAWNELTSDERFIAERTSTGKLSSEEVKHRHFCARCFYANESDDENKKLTGITG